MLLFTFAITCDIEESSLLIASVTTSCLELRVRDGRNTGTITKAIDEAKSSIQFDTAGVEINYMEAERKLPRHDEVMNPFAAMRRDSFPTNK